MQDNVKFISIFINFILAMIILTYISSAVSDDSILGELKGVSRQTVFSACKDNLLDGPVYEMDEMQSWISALLEKHAEEETKNFHETDIAFIEEQMDAYIDDLSVNSLRYNYEVSRMTYSLTKKLTHTTVRVRILYIEDIVPYNDLAYFSDPMDAAEYLAGVWEQGQRDIWFRCDGNIWTWDTLYNTGNAAEMNTARTAALPSSFNYSLEELPLEEEKLAHIELIYSVDEELLNTRSQRLVQEFERITEEIKTQEFSSDRELYEAIGQIIMERTEYDEDSIDSIYSDNRSEEVWINSSAYGALVSGKTICSGYAMAYKALCDCFALPCWVVTGNIKGAGHAWNMIQLNGKTYYVDCTQADFSKNDQYLFMDKGTLDERGYFMPANQVCPW